MSKLTDALRGRTIAAIAAASCACLSPGLAHAYKFEVGPEWEVNLDTSLQYTIGVRTQKRDNTIANHAFFHNGDYKFDRGDIVTNRIQGLLEFQAVYQQRMGFRASGSLWKDFAYDDDVEFNPRALNPGLLLGSPLGTLPNGAHSAYNGDRYSHYTKKYIIRGAEVLDAFLFLNGEVGDYPTYFKIGRLTQYWGNAFFFAFNNIAYSQHPLDYIKAFTQPGSEVKEIFMPRTQANLAVEITPQLSITAQYFMEFRPNRLPPGGTYFGFFDPLYQGPDNHTYLAWYGGGTVIPNLYREPPENNENFGVKLNWSPDWAQGDLGFYYRKLDETQAWSLINNIAGAPGTTGLSASGEGVSNAALKIVYPDNVKLYGVSYERAFGSLSTGFELSYRRNTGLDTAPFQSSNAQEGARGDVWNVIANGLFQLGSSPLWDSGILILEANWTYLNKVTKNRAYYNVGRACSLSQGLPDGDDGVSRGCATKSNVAVAILFEPQWLQVMPGLDLSFPMTGQFGVQGAGPTTSNGFYPAETRIYSFGIKGTYNSRTSVTLSYSGYHWQNGASGLPLGDPGGTNGFAFNGGGYTRLGFAGAGANGVNDRDWVSLVVKTSF